MQGGGRGERCRERQVRWEVEDHMSHLHAVGKKRLIAHRGGPAATTHVSNAIRPIDRKFNSSRTSKRSTAFTSCCFSSTYIYFKCGWGEERRGELVILLSSIARCGSGPGFGGGSCCPLPSARWGRLGQRRQGQAKSSVATAQKKKKNLGSSKHSKA